MKERSEHERKRGEKAELGGRCSHGENRVEVEGMAASHDNKENNEESRNWAHNIRDVRYSGSRCRSQVQNFGPRLDMDLLQARVNTRAQFGAEGIPHTVLDLLTSARVL